MNYYGEGKCEYSTSCKHRQYYKSKGKNLCKKHSRPDKFRKVLDRKPICRMAGCDGAISESRCIKCNAYDARSLFDDPETIKAARESNCIYCDEAPSGGTCEKCGTFSCDFHATKVEWIADPDSKNEESKYLCEECMEDVPALPENCKKCTSEEPWSGHDGPVCISFCKIHSKLIRCEM